MFYSSCLCAQECVNARNAIIGMFSLFNNKISGKSEQATHTTNLYTFSVYNGFARMLHYVLISLFFLNLFLCMYVLCIGVDA